MTKLLNKQLEKIDNFRIDVNTAEKLIFSSMPHFGKSSISLSAATNKILRQGIVAERDQPPFDRATMDGIAIAYQAFENGLKSYKIAGIQAAGSIKKSLPSMEHCFEVMTGAVMPDGTDTVIPVERISINNNNAELEPEYKPKFSEFIHPQASDHSKEDLLLEPGIRINGPNMAILTAAGHSNVMVTDDPKISIISTGDELIDVGQDIADHQIRSSNDRAIEAILFKNGYINTNRKHLSDNRGEILKEIKQLHEKNDVLILSGGVSMGKFDYIPEVLEELKIKVIFHKILQRPGLPMWFGVSKTQKPVFALPGNPVSTLVCLVRYVIPALNHASGQNRSLPEFAELSKPVDFKPDLCWFLPIKLINNDDKSLYALPKPTNTSGDFIGLRNTCGFVELPRGENHFPEAYKARFFRW
ncbi:MAG: molybdopterin molybdotransferase MoeA [Pseudomonadota bacterium]|nr:molybdopterin molybdotransferase MoeA [Pseudomonadota bacterium]